MLDCLVLGCGAAGIAALRKLHDAGLNVLGLEAADRIGGRILTVPFGAGLIDIGAAWCHGEKDNVVFELAYPLGLLARPDPDNNKWFILSDGQFVDKDTAEQIVTVLDDEVNKADKNSDKSISQYIRDAAKTNPILSKNPQLTNMCIEWYERNNHHMGGQSDPKQGKSVRALAEFWLSEGEPWINWKGKGYKTILDVLLNRHEDPSKEIPVQILLNKEVEKIDWKKELVKVQCKDGSTYEAKTAIVTFSVGVLKERHEKLFDPRLPAEKVNAIETMQMVVLDKIYIEFTKPWWKEPAYFTLLWRDEDKAKFSEEEKWITEVFGLQSVDYQPNVLLTWICGEGAKRMEQVSESDIKRGVEKILDLLRKNFDVAPVKNILRSQWASNPLARGTYAYRSVYTEQLGGGAAELGAPVYRHTPEGGKVPALCFAGEATSIHRHMDVHGAIESGLIEADRIIKALKN